MVGRKNENTSKTPSLPVYGRVLRKDEYPDLQLWKQKEYNTFFQSKQDKNSVLQPRHLRRGGTRLAESNENVATDWLETVLWMGLLHRQIAIRRHVRSLLTDMKNRHLGMKLPKTWSKANAQEPSTWRTLPLLPLHKHSAVPGELERYFSSQSGPWNLLEYNQEEDHTNYTGEVGYGQAGACSKRPRTRPLSQLRCFHSVDYNYHSRQTQRNSHHCAHISQKKQISTILNSSNHANQSC